MRHKKMMARVLMTCAATVVSMLSLQASAFADTTLADVTLPYPLGGAEVCVVGSCVPPVDGITNVHFSAVLQGAGVTMPALTTGSAPGCTANVNIAVFLKTLGVDGTLRTTVEFDRTDMNGNVIAGSHEVITKNISLGLASQTIPLASVCATIL